MPLLNLDEDSKFLSRKFILTVLVILMVGILPLLFIKAGVSDAICMTVLILLGAVGVSYGFMNLKEAKNELQAQAKDLLGVASDNRPEAPKQ